MSAGAPSTDPDGVAAFYDERYRGDYMAAHPPLERMRVAETLALVPPETGALLDYGCGSGAWIDLLRDSFPRARLAGVEVSLRAVEEARRRAGASGEVRHFDGGQAPFPDASFGLVFSYHVLEHVLDLGRTVADMARLVAPGGVVVACLPCANSGSLMQWAVRLTRGGVERSSTGEPRFFFEDPGHLRSLTTARLEAEFARHGLRLRSAWFTGPLADLEYLSQRRHRILDLFQPERARTSPGRVALAVARLALLALERAVRVHRARVDAGGFVRACALLIAKPLAGPVAAAVLDWLPRWEWAERREPRQGSAQYLVFERPGPRPR